MHILDSWYHLNRTDQIIGRAIRYCSHSALRVTEREMGVPPMAYNNCTIYMHAALIPGLETADMYAYRLAIRKARLVGLVQRLLKKNAWDCNLEMEAIIFLGLPPRVQIDAQGRTLPEYSANDQDYTTYCDYQVCKHECAVSLPQGEIDASTYGAADARRAILGKLDIVRHLFDDQVMVPESMIHDIFRDLPTEIRSDALLELIDGRRFKIRRGAMEGYLIKRAGFLIFQPAAVQDTELPMALRYSRAFQLSRKFMTLDKPVFAVKDVAKTVTPVEGPQVEEPLEDTGLLKRWMEWIAFVDGGPLPSDIPSVLRMWIWFRTHFQLPETRVVALRWWFDKMTTYEEQKTLLELAIKGNAELEQVVKGDILRTSTLAAYRIYNPETMKVEYICRVGGKYGACNSMFMPIVEKSLTKQNGPLGTLVGLLAPKIVGKESKNRIIFKTMDTTNTKSKPGGAECGNNSTMGDHRPRVKLLHSAGHLDSTLDPFIIPDSDATWDEAGSKKRMTALSPAHMKDFTHQPLCLYMEFLTRLLDARQVEGKRWFLSSVEATLMLKK